MPERVEARIGMIATFALIGLQCALLGCGDSGEPDQLVDCPKPGLASITITSPEENEVVTTNSVQVEFTVEGFRLAAPSDCNRCEDCGYVSIYGPYPGGGCGSPPPIATSSPATVIIYQEGGECPAWTAPGPVTISLVLNSRHPLEEWVSGEVTIDFQPN